MVLSDPRSADSGTRGEHGEGRLTASPGLEQPRPLRSNGLMRERMPVRADEGCASVASRSRLSGGTFEVAVVPRHAAPLRAEDALELVAPLPVRVDLVGASRLVPE